MLRKLSILSFVIIIAISISSCNPVNQDPQASSQPRATSDNSTLSGEDGFLSSMTFYIFDRGFELAVNHGQLVGVNREKVYLEESSRTVHIVYSGQTITVKGNPSSSVTGLPGINAFSVNLLIEQD